MRRYVEPGGCLGRLRRFRWEWSRMSGLSLSLPAGSGRAEPQWSSFRAHQRHDATSDWFSGVLAEVEGSHAGETCQRVFFPPLTLVTSPVDRRSDSCRWRVRTFIPIRDTFSNRYIRVSVANPSS